MCISPTPLQHYRIPYFHLLLYSIARRGGGGDKRKIYTPLYYANGLQTYYTGLFIPVRHRFLNGFFEQELSTVEEQN